MSTDPTEMLRRDYTVPFLAYLSTRDEVELQRAHDIGRRAISRSIGLLALVRVHSQVVHEVMGTVKTPEAAQEIAAASSVFLLEALSSFEMTQRGYMDLGIEPRGTHQ